MNQRCGGNTGPETHKYCRPGVTFNLFDLKPNPAKTASLVAEDITRMLNVAWACGSMKWSLGLRRHRAGRPQSGRVADLRKYHGTQADKIGQVEVLVDTCAPTPCRSKQCSKVNYRPSSFGMHMFLCPLTSNTVVRVTRNRECHFAVWWNPNGC